MPEQEGTQSAQQMAQTIAEAIRQLGAETTRQVIDASRTAASQEIGAERESETGLDDFFKHQSQVNAANSKRTYDEYQHESLESIRRNASLVARMAGLSTDHDSRVRNISEQAMQNAVVTQDMIAKRAIQHGDLATDRQWNVDEVAAAVAKTAVFSDAIAAAVARGVTEAMAQKS